MGERRGGEDVCASDVRPIAERARVLDNPTKIPARVCDASMFTGVRGVGHVGSRSIGQVFEELKAVEGRASRSWLFRRWGSTSHVQARHSSVPVPEPE